MGLVLRVWGGVSGFRVVIHGLGRVPCGFLAIIGWSRNPHDRICGFRAKGVWV